MMGHASTPNQKALQEALDGLWNPAIVTLMLLGSLMLSVALLLGIIGLMQRNRKKSLCTGRHADFGCADVIAFYRNGIFSAIIKYSLVTISQCTNQLCQ